jgi:hypothetical protein
MFTIDPKATEKDLKGKNIFKVLLSMNSHQVATPETSLEDARSYVFFFHEGKHRFSAYIGLHLLLTDRKLIYRYSANPFMEDELSEVENEARDFAEYLGAMMDEVDFASMSEPEQNRWIGDQGIFRTKTQPETVTATQPPVQEVAAAGPPSRPPAAPEQPAPAVEAKSTPEQPAASTRPAPETRSAERKNQPGETPAAKKVQPDVQVQTPPLAATKSHQEAAQKEATSGIETSPKQTTKKRSLSATGVVSRDREALARLLTSF